TVRFWDAATGKGLPPNGSMVRLWDAATGKELTPGDSHHGSLAAVAISTDGKTAFSWGMDGMIGRWDTATGKLLGSFRAPSGTTTAAFSPDAETIALANTDNSIHLIESATLDVAMTPAGKKLHKVSGDPTGIGALAFSADGKLLAARGGDQAIRLYDVVR